MKSDVRNIAVVGAGTMGAGIAQLAAQFGCTVSLIDVNRQVLNKGLADIKKRFDRSVEKGRLSARQGDEAFARIKPAEKIEKLSDVQLAIEAVVENLAVKRKVFEALDQATDKSATLATNTSSLPVSQIAESVADPARVVGMHFFNPAPIMPLVEVIAGQQSDTAHVDAAFDVATAWGKTAVRVKDTPGFIVNRVARGYYLEALRLLGEGAADISEIDGIMRTLCKFRMGPFELMDLVGLDVNLAVSTSVHQQMDNHARFTPHDIQRNLVEQGRLGRKTKQGFYRYDDGAVLPAYRTPRQNIDLSPLLSDTIRAFSYAAGAVDAGATEQFVIARILGAIINEAGLAFADRIASSDDIDTAMMKGTNYPNGPLSWSDEIGHRTVSGLLRALNESVDDNRYEASPLFAGAD